MLLENFDTYASGSTGTALSVLLIEDDVVQRTAVKLALKHTGQDVHVVEATSLQSGLEALALSSFSVILLDLKLPDSTSLETFKSIHELHPHVPIVVVSADEDKATATEAVRLGAQDFLVKSTIDAQHLMRSIRYAIVRTNNERLRGELDTFTRSESRFRHAFERAPIGIFIADAEANILRANTAFCRLLGYTEPELKNINALDLTHPEDVPDTRRYIKMLSESGVAHYKIEKRYLHKSGASIWVRVSGQVLEPTEDGSDCALLMVEDFTEERRAKECLNAQLEVAKCVSHTASLPEVASSILKTMVESLGTVYGELWILLEQDNRFKCVGSYVASGFECPGLETPANFDYLRFGDGLSNCCVEKRLLWLDDVQRHMVPARARTMAACGLTAAITAPIVSGDSTFGFIAVYDREKIPGDQAVGSMFSSVTSLIGQFLHRREAENRARRALLVEQREEFIATLAHDLKTPIAGANRMYDLFLEGVLGELQPRQRDLVGKLKDSSVSQLKMIQNLLEMYRYESGTSVLELGETRPLEVVDQCVASIQPLAEVQRVSISVAGEANDPVLADSTALTRVVQNLLDNALKYTAMGGHIEVRVYSDATDLKISVKDSGKGIAAELQPLLFQRFSQGRNRTTFGGSGIGLYLSKQIAEAHGGNISFVSESGAGSTFTVSIPLSPNQMLQTAKLE